MSNEPLVSIIMPVHNGETYIREALDSAEAQRYRPIEIIVVDDGSTDSTPAILSEFGSRIKVLRQENAGAAAARNAGLAAAHGELIAFLDADDLWLPRKLELQVAYLRDHPDVDLVACRWRVLRDNREDAPGVPEPQDTPDLALDTAASGWIYSDLLIDCIVHTTTVLMRRRLTDKIGLFDPDLHRGQDYDYWLRASRVTEIHTLKAALSYYRLHATNSTRKPQPRNYGAIVIERALRTWGRTGPDGRTVSLTAARRRLADIWSSFGYTHLVRGSPALARRAALRGVFVWPLSFKPWRLMAACAAAPLRRGGLGGAE